MDIRALPKLEGTVHVNMALVLKFLPSYLLQPTTLPDVPRRRDAADDAFLFHQGPARGLGKVRFADWRTSYDVFADVPNVAVFREQTEGLVDLVTKAGPDPDQAKDLDLLLAIGELFTLVVYGQLILEQASLTGLDPDLMDRVFDVLVRDFSALRRGLVRQGLIDQGAADVGAGERPQTGGRHRSPRQGLAAGP